MWHPQQWLRKKQEENEIAKVLWEFRYIFLTIGVVSFVINILYLVPTIYMLQIYDRVLMSRNHDTLLMLTIIAVFLYLVMGFLEWVRSQLMIRLGNNLDLRLNGRIFQASFEKALVTSRSNASQAMSDLITVRQFLTGNGLFAFFDAPWLFIYLAVTFWIHPVMGIFGSVAAIILIIIAVMTEIASRKPIAEANKYAIMANSFISANFRNAEAIEAMGMLENVKRHWFPKQEQMLALQSIASERASMISSITKFLRISFQSLILGLGALLAIDGKITPGMMIAGSILMGRALSPVDLAIGTWKMFVSARNAYNRLKELLITFPSRQTRFSLPPPKGHLVVSNLIVVPPGSTAQILKGLTFEVKPGEVVAVIGPSAAGKSTLARAMVGVWKPYVGTVRLDGADIHHWNRDELGPFIGYLPQDVELLDGTIAENIARFGEVDSKKVVEAARIAGVHEMILQLPQGYETQVGEGGSVLSGGQRQRVALARAIYGMPSFIVLDEPNSNLDEAGDAALVTAIKTMKELGKTIIVISHRPSILVVVDKIMVLVNGVIQLYGPREQVLKVLVSQSQQQQPPQQKPAHQSSSQNTTAVSRGV
ncbi:MAG: type I secretion system permease/ATPase [Syntrophobacterales bacterium]|nr:type I secretion system permease/ATPase [Syntrophobacterales bacterium]